MFICFVGYWLIGTYEFVNEQATADSREQFDPYKLLHIDNDGSFNTREIKQAYKSLAKRYHPDHVDLDKIPFEKAQKRWLNLVRAYETLTKKNMFDNYRLYGDPDGSRMQRALDIALPSWLVQEEFHLVLFAGFFATILFLILGLRVWTNKNETQNESGIENASRDSMRDYIVAVLEDNPK